MAEKQDEVISFFYNYGRILIQPKIDRSASMSNVVIKVTPEVLAKINYFYQDKLLDKKPPYTEFVAKDEGVAITAYTSGKVMFQGKNAEKEAAIWTAQGGTATSKKNGPQATPAANGLPKNISQMPLIGSDEVGNGSYFGPVIVCAVYAGGQQLTALKKLGVKDSKMLTDQQIRQLAPQIEALVPFQKLTVTPQKYNAIQPQYNAVRMKVALHNQAIYLLQQKLKPQQAAGVLIDQFTPEANYRKYLRSEAQQAAGPIYFVTKGEQYHLAVAAASILCRATFLTELEKASQEVGFTLPSGAGSKSDQVAAKLLQQGGLELLGRYAKLHFANTQKAAKLAHIQLS